MDQKNSNGFFEAALKTLAHIIGDLKSEPFKFAIGISLLLILSYAFSYRYSTFIPFYVVIGTLVFIFLVAIIAQQIEVRSQGSGLPQEREGFPEMDQEVGEKPSATPSSPTAILHFEDEMPDTMEYLNAWLGKLNDSQFRSVIQLTLDPDDQSSLTRPVELISRIEFLNNMKIWGRLEEVRYRLETDFARFKPS